MGGLLSVVAQKIVVEIEAAENVTIKAIHSTYPTNTIQKGKKYKINLNDMFGDEERDAVCELNLPALSGPKGMLAHKCNSTNKQQLILQY